MNRHYRIAAVLIWVVAVACSRSTPISASPLPSDPVAALAWLPSDVTLVGHQPRAQVALVSFARGALKEKVPACVDRLSGQVAHLFMLSRYLGDPAVNVVYGLTDRESSEACAAETFRALTGRQVALARDGAFTRASAGDAVMHLAWTGDGWLAFHPDRSRVEAMLRRGPSATLAPTLRSLLARVSLADGLWTVSSDDLTQRFIGVRSTGFIQRLTVKEGGGVPVPSGVPVTFLFEDERQARQAVEALAAAGRDDALPPPLRNALSALRPTLRGTELDADAAMLMTDEAALGAAVELMKKRAGAERRGSIEAR